MKQANNTTHSLNELLTKEELTSIRSGESPWANTVVSPQKEKEVPHNEVSLVAS